jgi:hypothetical protein
MPVIWPRKLSGRQETSRGGAPDPPHLLPLDRRDALHDRSDLAALAKVRGPSTALGMTKGVAEGGMREVRMSSFECRILKPSFPRIRRSPFGVRNLRDAPAKVTMLLRFVAGRRFEKKDGCAKV